jgi:hypothetical protein
MDLLREIIDNDWPEDQSTLKTREASKGSPTFTKKELSQNFKLVWLSLSEAISTVSRDKPTNYEGYFIQHRDIELLKKVWQMKREN